MDDCLTSDFTSLSRGLTLDFFFTRETKFCFTASQHLDGEPFEMVCTCGRYS
jgi:hypothetical protein